MTAEDRPAPAVARDRLRRSISRRGYSPPLRTAPPVVVWRAAGCRCWVLRVYLDPAGWHLEGARFRVEVAEWASRVARDDEEAAAVRSGEMPTLARDRRRVDGISRSMPLDLDQWTHGKFEIGCEHGRGSASSRDLAADCRHAKESRQSVHRLIEW